MKRKKWVVIILLCCVGTWFIVSPYFFQFRTSDQSVYDQFKTEKLAVEIATQKIRQFPIHYFVTGDSAKTTIVFIHGSPGSWNTFINYFRDADLVQHFQMLGIDRPGFGKSNFGQALPLPVQCNLIGLLLKKLRNNHPLILVGHSLGGALAVKIAAEFPDDVQGLLLLAASVNPKAEPVETWRYLLQTYPFRHLLPGAFRPSNDELLFFKQDVTTLPDDLNKITCPVIIVQGLEDSFVPPENAYYAQKMLKNAANVQLITLKNIDHFLPWSHFTLIKNLLLNFK